jgi:hypothetical protein
MRKNPTRVKIIVAGTRTFDNYVLLDKALREVVVDSMRLPFSSVQVVSGAQRKWDNRREMFIGADYLGELWSHFNHAELRRFPADWDRLGRSAGPTRNRQMADYADCLIAFWDGTSRGTKNMINVMRALDKPVYLVKYTMFTV